MSIRKNKEYARKHKLVGWEMYCNAPDELIERVCNGIGPEWFPSAIRTLLDKMHPSLRIVADIHDMWYYYGDGTEKDFKAANRAFDENGDIIAKDKFAWYNPRRYLVQMEAAHFAKMCDIGGKFAYYAAIANRKNDNGEEDAADGAEECEKEPPTDEIEDAT